MLLEARGVSAGYGAGPALKGVSVAIDEGEVVALIGANGAGKSTLLRTLSGLLTPTAGQIIFAGRRIDGQPAHRIVRLGMVHVPEGRMVFGPMTVLDNMKMGAYRRKDHKQVRVDLEVMFEHFPILRERAAQLAWTLSGGEQQMLAVARALMTAPRLLLMDEPSMGLSPKLVEAIGDIVGTLRSSGLSVLLVEQNAVMALAVADRAYVLETGNVVLEGEAASVAMNDGVRSAYLGG